MATVAHCLYCFETLSASLERRKAQSLSQVESFLNENALSGSNECADLRDTEHGPAKERISDMLARNGERPQVAISNLPARLTVLNHQSSSSPPSSSVLSVTSSLRSVDSPGSFSSSKSLLSSASRTTNSPRVSHHPMFVTWNTIVKSGHKRLRGCIGTFEPLELEHGLKTYALTAAFEDTRFPRIEARELPSLECSVTLLTDFETAPDPMSWEIGKHGLRIAFTHQSRRYGATYLPDVALEQGWSKAETLVSLMHKAGWRGRDEDWHKVSDLNVVRYQGHRVSAKYEDWQALNEWIGSN